MKSLPNLEAWIEILGNVHSPIQIPGHSLCWECELKFFHIQEVLELAMSLCA